MGDMKPCAVCSLLDNDRTPKATAKWCGFCGTFICDECQVDPARRALAAAAKAMLWVVRKKAPKRT